MMATSADAVVIGGGVVGASIAYHLMIEGFKKVILCEKDTFCSGSTGRCGAGVREQWGAKDNCLLARASLDMFENLQEELGYDRDIELKQKGYLLLAHTEKEWRQFQQNIALQNGLGIESELVSAYGAREIVPALSTAGLYGAAFNSRDGHANPFHVTRAYLKAAERLGAELRFFTEVTAIEVSSNRVLSVTTEKGDIATPVVVNAAGPWAQHVAARAGVDLPLYTQRHQILVTEPLGPILDPMVMSFSKGFYIQQTPHGSLIMGLGDPKEPLGHDIGCSWQFLRDMSTIITSVLPCLAQARVVRQWSGLYTNTPDAHPILGGVPGLEGYFHAVGFSGHGFMLAPVVGKRLAELIVGGPVSRDIAGLDLGRFARGDLMIEPSVV